MTKTLLGLLAVLVVAVPLASAHGPVNAREVETLIVDDELSDAFYTTGGYDLGEIYLGEAWVAGLGEGLYIHTILFGTYTDMPPGGGAWSATFRLATQDGKTIERTLTTTDGTAFDSDFDVLEIEAGSEEAEIQRAFIAYAGTDLKRGSTITEVTAVTRVGDEARDIAPGGIYAPMSQGLADVPMGDSSQVIESYTLVGPSKYASARLQREGDGLVLNVTSLLQEGDQHILIDGASVGDASTFELKAKQSRLVPVTLNGASEVAVTTDIGGRTAIKIVEGESGLAAVHEDGSTLDLTSDEVAGKDAPGPGILLVLAVVLLALLARRR